MIRGLRLAALIALAPLALGTGRPALAQDSLVGKPIASFEWQGLRALSEETMQYYLGLQLGSPWDPEALNRNLHGLWSRGLIDDIKVDASPDGEGVHLKVTVVERPLLRSITYKGLKRVSSQDITDRLLKERLRVREGDALDFGELERLREMLQTMYQEKGYRFADVKYTLEDSAPGEKRVLFTVDEGDRVRIGKIAFSGNEVYGDYRLRMTMKKTKETGLITRLMKRDIYNPATLREDLDKVRDLYRRAGYKNVEVSDPKLEVVAKHPNAATPEAKKRRLYLDIPIAEGQRFKFGEITIEGNERYSDEILLRVFRRRNGGWLHSKIIDDGVEKIGDIYRNSGFIYSQVSTELRERDAGTADVVVHVTEGDQYKVGSLEFEGNTRTRDKVLRREFRVQEGTFLNMGALKSSLYKINQLGYFKLNEDDPIKFEDFDTEHKTVDLRVQGQESDRTELQVGGGWSELDGFFGQFSVRTQNFLGRGESLGVSYQSGKIRDYFDLSYFIPWFLDRPQSIGVQAFRSNQDYSVLLGSQFVQDSKGVVLSYGRNFGYFNSFSLGYTNSSLRDQRTLTLTDGSPFVQDLSRRYSALRPYYSYDSIDNRFEPTRGTRFTLGVDYAGGFLGGDTYFYRPQVSLSWFKPISLSAARTVFAINLEAGYIDAFNGHELIYSDRFFLGGENTIRGFRYRSIVVTNDAGTFVPDQFGFAQGGDHFMQANLEYHFLLGGPFRVLLFTDAGGTYGAVCGKPAGDPLCQESGRIRYSAGIEMRILVPVFGAPLRFIYAKNLDPLPADEFENFQFSIGTSF
jgi:outer membrane protein insertion porin family